jgi:hypothetical protein
MTDTLDADALERLFYAVYGQPPALNDPDLLREVLSPHLPAPAPLSPRPCP